MKGLTAEERLVIEELNDSLYTPQFVEEWLGRTPENVLVNAPAALQQMSVIGFVRAVRCMVKVGMHVSEEEDGNDGQLEDIAEFLLNEMSPDQLFGYEPREVLDDDVLMEKIRVQLDKTINSNVPYNDTIEHAVWSVLEEEAKQC